MEARSEGGIDDFPAGDLNTVQPKFIFLLLTLTSSFRYTLSDLGAVRCLVLLRPPASRSIPCLEGSGVEEEGREFGEPSSSVVVD